LGTADLAAPNAGGSAKVMTFVISVLWLFEILNTSKLLSRVTGQGSRVTCYIYSHMSP